MDSQSQGPEPHVVLEVPIEERPAPVRNRDSGSHRIEFGLATAEATLGRVPVASLGAGPDRPSSVVD